ncbi:hypothetical protein [Virgisporangium aurantiacum]|uniref:Bacteriocin biosynthesis cyclodehydratase domain-containing protein n=1 Tax=Virgisporangium aurantiacum TaxID=175570 RepID=A0A8J3Z1G8_9ACTN|nr:hypothetical protein [Virgisporangium aurantiacum]GIJ53465.1 hypothetical protein Vau01_009810 [Virgisporangium aurantiacum]
MRRPLLIPHMRRLWRDPNTLQLGTDPSLATVLELGNPAMARVLDLLDGTRSEPVVIAAAADYKVEAHEAEALLAALHDGGLLVAGRALLPVGLTDNQRERMAREAGALALARLRAGPPPRAEALARATPARPVPSPGDSANRATQPAPPPRGAQTDRATKAAPDAALTGRATKAALPDAAQTDRATQPAPSRTGRAGRGPSSRPRAGATSLALPPDPGTPAEMLRRRAAARVLVAGHAWLGALVASALGAAGIGRLDPALDGWTRIDDAMVGGLLPADAHRSRASAAADAVRRVAPEAVLTQLREGTATFVVRVGSRPGTALATRGVRERGAPRLDVYLRDGVVVVGPLVRPGASPCGQCLELHRRDRDRDWPVIAAQLATGRDTVEACAVTTALAGAAYAVEEVLRHTDGRPVRTLGATVEISGPGAARRRSWPAHPGCDCSRRRRSSGSGRQSDLPSNNGS